MPTPIPVHLLNATSQIVSTITRLRQLTRKNVLSQWQVCPQALPLETALDPNAWPTWSAAKPNARHHIAWEQGRKSLWLGQRFTLPSHLNHYPLQGLCLRLDLTWWAELAQIYVQGQQVQTGDLYDCFCRVKLCDQVIPGSVIDVAIHLISPHHDPGALVKSWLWFEPEDVQQPDPGMIADELAIVQSYIQAFQSEQLPQLAAKVKSIDWTVRSAPQEFHHALTLFRQSLWDWSDWIQQRTIQWIGHAHLDMAWLWPVSETWEVAERTFASALTLLEDFPELRFCHSSPALYDWIERNRPEQFAQIQAKVQQGQWEIAAGLWVEPEFNLVSGESIVRQVLYGQRYTQAKFGVLSATAWLPDSFGFCWQLPQILKQGGIQYFVTQKLRWNDTSDFPYEAFRWRSPDGTEIVSIMLPPIGTRIDPVKMASHAQHWEQATGSTTSFWLPGLGDHGGGPTRDMVEVARRWQTSRLTPKLEPATSAEFCQRMAQNPERLPVWDHELYLEFHRGCYTSHGDQKRYNRQCEALLTEAELFSSLATLITQAPYPKAALETAWKKVLFNQFHDILPGSAIPQVFVDANRDWHEVLALGTQLRHAAWEAIAQQVTCGPRLQAEIPCYPILVFNSLNWARTELVRTQVPYPLPVGHTWQVLDANLQPLESQWGGESLQPGERNATLLFYAENVPSVGYQLFWVRPTTMSTEVLPPPPVNHWVMENDALRVTLAVSNGTIGQIYDKVNQREVLSGFGNHLQFFQDQGQYWDAWNIAPDYAQHRLPDARLESITWVSASGLEQRIRVRLLFGNSHFVQDYVLEAQASVLKIETKVQWQTDHVLVKTAFPLTVSAAQATYDIACGVIHRATLPNPAPLEPWETAKWEVPALFWADLSNRDSPYRVDQDIETQDIEVKEIEAKEIEASESFYGVSLINDCKYGYDAQPNQLRLTLLRGATWPDPGCDRGEHQFNYAIFPHSGTWKEARTDQKGAEFNRPLQTHWISSGLNELGSLPPSHSFLFLNGDQVSLMALKQSEENASEWILRCHESQGDVSHLLFSNALGLEIKHGVDILERKVDDTVPLGLHPWQILSLKLGVIAVS